MIYNFDTSKKPPTRKEIEKYRSHAYQELLSLTEQRKKIKRLELIVMILTGILLMFLLIATAYFINTKINSFSETEVFLLAVTVFLFWALKVFAVIEWLLNLINTFLQELLMHAEIKSLKEKEQLDQRILQLQQILESFSFISQERNKEVFESISEHTYGFSYVKNVKRMRRTLTIGEEIMLVNRRFS